MENQAHRVQSQLVPPKEQLKVDSDTWNKTSTSITCGTRVTNLFCKILSCLTTAGADTEIVNTITRLYTFLPGNITPKATEANYNL